MFGTIFGIFLVLAGTAMVIKSDWFLKNFGRIPWAEAKIGGTMFFYKLVGILLILVGLTLIFNLFGGIVLWFFGPLIPNN